VSRRSLAGCALAGAEIYGTPPRAFAIPYRARTGAAMMFGTRGGSVTRGRR
jgi:hypothetical protein